MRIKTYRWYEILLSFLPLVWPVWNYGQAWADDAHKLGHHPSEMKEFLIVALLGTKFSFPVALSITIVLLSIIKLTKETAPKRTLRNFLNYLHKQHFPHESGGRNPQYRVTLFVPTRRGKFWRVRYPTLKKYLALYVRSGDIFPKSNVLWSITRSELAHFDGIAAYAWVTGNFVDISGLCDYNAATEPERQQYLERTFLDEATAKKLHVLSRSYQALVIVNRSSEKVGVLMMECVEPNGLTQLSAKDWYQIADTLQCLFLA